MLDQAEALDPFLPIYVVEERIVALYELGRYDDMRLASPALPNQTRLSRLYRAAARVREDQIELGRDIVRGALAADPTLSSEYVRSQQTYRDPEKLASLLTALDTAGLPDTALRPVSAA